MGAADPFDLQRFVTAQAPVFASALEELKEGLSLIHISEPTRRSVTDGLWSR